MATLAVQNLVRNGAIADITSVAAAASDVFPNDGNTIVEVINGDAAPITIVATAQGDLGDLTTETGAAITVTNAKSTFLGPFDKAKYNNSNGQVTLTPSAIANITYNVLRLPMIR